RHATYPLSLHDALPISATPRHRPCDSLALPYSYVNKLRQSALSSTHESRLQYVMTIRDRTAGVALFHTPLQSYFDRPFPLVYDRSEEHTSELQSRENLV